MHHRRGSSSRPNDVNTIPDFSTPEGTAMANLELARLGSSVQQQTEQQKTSAAPAAAPVPPSVPAPPPIPPPAPKLAASHNGAVISNDVRLLDFRDTDTNTFHLNPSGKTLSVSAESNGDGELFLRVTRNDGTGFNVKKINLADSPSVEWSIAAGASPDSVNISAAATTAALPTGVIHNTMRYNGSSWETSGRILNYANTNLGGGVQRMTAVAGDNVPQLYIDSSISTSMPLRIESQRLSHAVQIGNSLGSGVVVTAGTTGINVTGTTFGVTATSFGTAVSATGSSVGVAASSPAVGVSASSTTGTAVNASSGTGKAINAQNLSTTNPAIYSANSGSGLQAVAIRANVQTGLGIYSDASDGQSLNCYNNSGANPTAHFKNDGSAANTKVIDIDAQGGYGLYAENIYTGASFTPRAISARCNNAVGIAIEAISGSGMALSAVSGGASDTVTLYAQALYGTAGAFYNDGAAGAPTVLISNSLPTSLALSVEGRVAVSNGPIQLTGYNLEIDGNAVVGARAAGWSAATGTATRTSFDTGSVTLSSLAEHVKALIDDLLTHGLIGA